MGGNQSSEAPQDAPKDGHVDDAPKAEESQKQAQPKDEPQKAGAEKKPEAAKAEEKSLASESKKEDPKVAEPKKTAAPSKSPPAGPLQPGAQPKVKPAAKPVAKTSAKAPAAPKKKPQQPGPPQQPGLITPEAQAAPKKAAKGEKGKGGGKKGALSGIQLCVRNLVKDATTEQLQSLFQPFGELIGVDVKKNTDGTCRGYGFVTYVSMADANKAISAMNNKQVEGKNLIVVLSDRQQGTTKAEREAQTSGGKGGKGKDGKEGKGGDKGKGKSKQPANIATTLPAASTPPSWPYQGEGAAYPYGYGYPMVSPMAAYANQGYANTQQAAALQAMQAQFISQAQQALQMQAFHSSLGGLSPGLNPNMNTNISASNMAPNTPAPAPAVAAPSATTAAPSDEAPAALKQEHEGQLKSISAKNGYGFIACSETKAHYKRDVFVDSSLLPEGIQVNDKVIFSLTLSEKGHPRATSVRLVGQVAAR